MRRHSTDEISSKVKQAEELMARGQSQAQHHTDSNFSSFRFHNLIAKGLIDGRILSLRWDACGSDATRSQIAQSAPAVECDQEHKIIRRSLLAAIAIETGGMLASDRNVAASEAGCLKRCSSLEPDIPPTPAYTH